MCTNDYLAGDSKHYASLFQRRFVCSIRLVIGSCTLRYGCLIILVSAGLACMDQDLCIESIRSTVSIFHETLLCLFFSMCISNIILDRWLINKYMLI